jgi:hypothetical protein
MESRRLRAAQFLAVFTAALMLLPTKALAQDSVAKELLDEWFYSRLLWGAVVGLLLGLIAGLAHLCRLRFETGILQVNSQARRKFLAWLAAIFAVGAIVLFLDAWLLYPFNSVSLQFWEAATQVWMNYRMLAVLLATLFMFTVAVAVATRLKGDCRCRYAFLPGPQGK